MTKLAYPRVRSLFRKEGEPHAKPALPAHLAEKVVAASDLVPKPPRKTPYKRAPAVQRSAETAPVEVDVMPPAIAAHARVEVESQLLELRERIIALEAHVRALTVVGNSVSNSVNSPTKAPVNKSKPLQTAEEKRQYMRDYMRAKRAAAKASPKPEGEDMKKSYAPMPRGKKAKPPPPPRKKSK
jgi:hypothetical protein